VATIPINFHLFGKFNDANSPWYFFAALSYAFAAWISSLKDPMNLLGEFIYFRIKGLHLLHRGYIFFALRNALSSRPGRIKIHLAEIFYIFIYNEHIM